MGNVREVCAVTFRWTELAEGENVFEDVVRGIG